MTIRGGRIRSWVGRQEVATCEGGMSKQTVLLLGASGTMGHAAFKELWKRRDRYDVVILVRPSKRNKRLFRPYEREAAVTPISGRGVAQGNGFKIVWGDATQADDMQAAVRGADWVLAQPDFGANGENRWTSVQRDTLCWPYGLSLHGDLLAVADSGNNRVMLWRRETRP